MACSGQAKALFVAGTLAALALILMLNEKYDTSMDHGVTESIQLPKDQLSLHHQFHMIPGTLPPHILKPPEDARPYWARKVDTNYTRWLDTLASQGYIS